MKIYTRTGDDGSTGLYGGARASKADPVVRALGDLDEANCALGAVLAAGAAGEGSETLLRAQARLFEIGAELASVPGSPHAVRANLGTIVGELEASIDSMEQGLEPLRAFILPGGTAVGAMAHWARAVCRRAERSLVQVEGPHAPRGDLIAFVNRLSDWLFVFARYQNARSGVAEHPWTKEPLP